MLPPDNEGRISPEVEPKKPTCVVLGSFRFNRQINEVIGQLEMGGIHVLAPKAGAVVGERFGFKFLDTDILGDAVEGEVNFLTSMHDADFAYVVNPGSYIGNNVVLEMRVGMAWGVPFFAMKRFAGPWRRLNKPLVEKIRICSVTDLLDTVQSGKLETDVKRYIWHRPKENREQVDHGLIRGLAERILFQDLYWKFRTGKGERQTVEKFAEERGASHPFDFLMGPADDEMTKVWFRLHELENELWYEEYRRWLAEQRNPR